MTPVARFSGEYVNYISNKSNEYYVFSIGNSKISICNRKGKGVFHNIPLRHYPDSVTIVENNLGLMAFENELLVAVLREN